MAIFTKKGGSLLLVSMQTVLKKEIFFIFRFPQVFLTAFLFPFIEILLLGFIVANNVQQIDTVIYDVANTQESQRLIDQFLNTNDFNVVDRVNSDKKLYDMIVRGEAKIGIKVPADYTRRIIEQDNASVLVVVDGSNASITNEITNTSSIITLQNSLQQMTSQGQTVQPVPIEMRTSVLFNPDGRAVNYLLPGALIFEITVITMMFIASSFVTEREQGNLEQLSITPINATGMLLGKMIPYGIMALVQQFILLMELRVIFGVPIHGSFTLLMVLFIPYIFLTLGLGVIISFIVNTQMEVIQLSALARIIPAIYLSGYIFPIEGMPESFQKFVKFIPESQLMEIIRGIILRGTGIEYLWSPVISLIVMSLIVFVITAILYEKMLAKPR